MSVSNSCLGTNGFFVKYLKDDCAAVGHVTSKVGVVIQVHEFINTKLETRMQILLRYSLFYFQYITMYRLALITLSTPIYINPYTLYNEKYFPDDHFSYYSPCPNLQGMGTSGVAISNCWNAMDTHLGHAQLL